MSLLPFTILGGLLLGEKIQQASAANKAAAIEEAIKKAKESNNKENEK